MYFSLKSFIMFVSIGFLLFARIPDVNAQTVAVVNTQATQSAKPTISYELPYPGMLPDSPLYPLKLLRDKLITLLVSQPEKKVEIYLLQANKGILAAQMLQQKGNIDLAVETALKAENNMTLIPEQLVRMQEKPEDALFTMLNAASIKHQQVLTSMIAQANGQNKKTLEQVRMFSRENQATFLIYKNKNSKTWNK